MLVGEAELGVFVRDVSRALRPVKGQLCSGQRGPARRTPFAAARIPWRLRCRKSSLPAVLWPTEPASPSLASACLLFGPGSVLVPSPSPAHELWQVSFLSPQLLHVRSPPTPTPPPAWRASRGPLLAHNVMTGAALGSLGAQASECSSS